MKKESKAKTEARARRRAKVAAKADNTRALHLELGMVKLPPLTDKQRESMTKAQVFVYEKAQLAYARTHGKRRVNK